jgi:hypothetical protein
MIIHYVKVDDIGARFQYVVDLLAQARKVG